LVVGAVLALLGTLGVFWSGGIRERYSNRKLSENATATAKANEQAAVANKMAAGANERAANLEKEAAIANLELQKLKTPRRVTAEQKAKFMAYLSTYPDVPRTPVILVQNAVGNETTEYADQLWQLLEQGGFGGATKGGTDIAGNTMQGVPAGTSLAVAVHRNAAVPPAAALLVNALLAADIPAVSIVPKGDLPYLHPGEVLLFVTERR
jgi:hypothetical protein